jgi:choloylglycine hydrolase
VYESTTRPNIVWVELADLDFAVGSPQLKLDLIGQLALQGGIAGNVSDRFKDTGPMTFLSLQLPRAPKGATNTAHEQ